MTKPKVTKDTCTSGKINNVAAHDGAAPLGFDATIMYANQDPSYHDPDISDCEPVGVSCERADMSEIAHTLAECARLHLLGMAPRSENTVNIEATQIIPENDLERAQMAAVTRMIADPNVPAKTKASAEVLFRCILGRDGTGKEPARLPNCFTAALWELCCETDSDQVRDDIVFLLRCVPNALSRHLSGDAPIRNPEVCATRFMFVGRSGTIMSREYKNGVPRGIRIDGARPVAIIALGAVTSECLNTLRYTIHPGYQNQIFCIEGVFPCR